ncbi:MAG TPA: heavy metal-associated domain-containing protein [Flavobacteriaceae bacterium]|nr:heavy metal-associated domain-containing protein [Flavobacteriaceae bacterium]
MKTIAKTLLLLVVFLSIISCKNQSEAEIKVVETETAQKILNPDAEYVTASFEIEGMACPMGCAKPIEKNLAKLDGVKDAKVDFESKTATIVFDQELANQDIIIGTVKKTGESYNVVSWNNNPIENN